MKKATMLVLLAAGAVAAGLTLLNVMYPVMPL